MAIIRKLEPKNQELPPPKCDKKTRLGESHDESNWLISYADMMTLLCVFYIMLFSMSKMNTAEFEKVKEQVAEQLGQTYQSPTENLGKYLTQVLAEKGIEQQASLTSDGVSVTIAFHSTLFFESASAEVRDEGKKILEDVIQKIQQSAAEKNEVYKVIVEGHTDSQPISSERFPSNWELSSARANRVVRLFVEKGFATQSLMPVGFGDTRPLVEEKDSSGNWLPESMAKNRRVILRVISPAVDYIPWKAMESHPDRQPAGETAVTPTPIPESLSMENQTPVTVDQNTTGQ